MKRLYDAIINRIQNGPSRLLLDMRLRIERLELKPGDRLIVKFNGYLTKPMAEGIRDQFAADVLPAGVKAYIIDKGIDLSVVTAAELEARAA